ncbi:hypothetical protein AC1031_014440 [Aphanomyces cochlioides]|nr:hypothetical protein AC1031_014440 [Aphanomyces cochlioides]
MHGLPLLVAAASALIASSGAVSSLALNASCHTLVFQGHSGPLLNEFQQAKYVYQSDGDVCFVEDVNEFRASKILFYPKHDASSAKTCLLRGLPSAETFPGQISLPALVDFINHRTHKLRLPSGRLHPLADTIHALENSLFKVKPQAICRSIPASEISVAVLRDHVLRNEPLVIKQTALELVQASSWSTKTLIDRIGSRQVHVKISPNGDFEGCEPLSWWEGDKEIPDYVATQLESPDKVLVRPAATNMPFSTFIDKLTSTAPTATSYYLEYLSMATYVPELIDDAPKFDWAPFLKLDVANLWFGDGKSVGKLHFDPFENLMTMVAGRKEFILYDPSDNTRIYEGHIREAQYDLEGNQFIRRRLMESTSMVNSPVDIQAPDLEMYPRFAEANAMRCVVEEGDTIFVPSFWWHEVVSAPAKDEPRNVAVNYWYKPVYNKDFPCQTCPLRFSMAYADLLEQAQSSHEEL